MKLTKITHKTKPNGDRIGKPGNVEINGLVRANVDVEKPWILLLLPRTKKGKVRGIRVDFTDLEEMKKALKPHH